MKRNQEQANKSLPLIKEELPYAERIRQERDREIDTFEVERYTTKFSVKDFLDIIPNPEAYFNNPQRRAGIDTQTMQGRDVEYAVVFLKQHFNRIYNKTIMTSFYQNYYHMIRTATQLETCGVDLIKKRKTAFPEHNTRNIELLREIAYIQHKKEITTYLEEVEQQPEDMNNNDNNNDNKKMKLTDLPQCCDICGYVDEESLDKENLSKYEKHYDTLLELLPDADPEFLKSQCLKYFRDRYKLEYFVSECLSKKKYPTKEEHQRKKDICEKIEFYTTKFNVTRFLELFPDPVTYFNDPTIEHTFPCEDDEYVLTFLKNHFNRTYIKTIYDTFDENNCDVVRAANALEKCPREMKVKRKMLPFEHRTKNIELLQHIAYVQYKEDIMAHLDTQQKQREDKITNAKVSGLLMTCECCYDDEVLFDEMISCQKGHTFCKTCVQKGCEVMMGQGKLDFHCLQNCETQFSLYDLQVVLSPNIFSKIAQRKQLEEVKAAGLDDLEFCPFCDFALIPAPDDKVFRCMNVQCLKETCRLCKEFSHIPFRCNEVEKEEEIKIRTYIENKMTDALVRTCYKCNMKFIKTDGCNKMTCSCGAIMCYVCKQPVKDYTHFNGQGGHRYELCPLFSDTKKLHAHAVYKEGKKAREELGIDANLSYLKHDPTKDLEKYYSHKHHRVTMH